MSRENQRIPVMVGRPQPQPRAAEARPELAAEGTAEAQNFQTPLIDIHEGPDGLVLEADLPGATEEGVVIQLEENVLTLHAHVPSPAPEGARVVHEEYRVADFHRSFILSDEVERSRIAAELKNGVLRLTLPKAERAKTRRIEIKS
jgi:HSP20 family molecular chaperone IbpA